MPPQPKSPLFPYTTLFRSRLVGERVDALAHPAVLGARVVRPGAARHHGARLARHRHRQRSEEHTSELQSQFHLVCRLLLEKKKIEKKKKIIISKYRSTSVT